MPEGKITIPVRHAQPHPMGFLHHATYPIYFEQGRTELLRTLGMTYRDLEDQGFLLVLARLDVRYRRPAQYDDLLTLKTRVIRTTAVRIEHGYRVLRDGQL